MVGPDTSLNTIKGIFGIKFTRKNQDPSYQKINSNSNEKEKEKGNVNSNEKERGNVSPLFLT